MKKFLLLALVGLGLTGFTSSAQGRVHHHYRFHPSEVTGSTPLQGLIECNWSGCSGSTPLHITEAYAGASGCAGSTIDKFVNDSGAFIGWYVDDSDPCQSYDVSQLCNWTGTHLVVASDYGYNVHHYGCGNNDQYVVNTNEWYPYGNGGLHAINGWAATNNPDSITTGGWACDDWGWISQWDFYWGPVAGSVLSPPRSDSYGTQPGGGGTNGDIGWNKHLSYCDELGHRHNLNDGTWGSGVDLYY